MTKNYEKPSMVIEKVDVAVLATQSGSNVTPDDGGYCGPIQVMIPMFGLCCS